MKENTLRALAAREKWLSAEYIKSFIPAPKWILISPVIGAVSGLMAILFYLCVDYGTKWLLGGAGYHPATVAGDAGGFHQATGFAHPWAIPLVVAAGAFVAAVLVFRVAPETEGHGTDAAIRSINGAPTAIRWRVAPVKMIASAITIGSGGSGGSEGPTAQISATAASVLARKLKLSHDDARIAVTTGLASGVGAIFRAPFGGAVLGFELLYRKDTEPAMLIPSLIASLVAWIEFRAVYGHAPMFGHQPGFQLAISTQLLVFPILGLCCGLLARLYSRTFYSLSGWFAKWPGPRAIRPGVAGLATGALGLLVPGILGTGYGTIQYVMNSQRILHLSLVVLIAMPFAKILATSLSIGSGGSGGVFGPGMVTGAAVGALLWRLAEPHGLAPASPVPLVVVGMAACLGAAAHAPISIILIAAETCGSYSLMIPAAIAVPVAVIVTGSLTLYESQPTTRKRAGGDDLVQADSARALGKRGSKSRADRPAPVPSAVTTANAQVREVPIGREGGQLNSGYHKGLQS